MYLINSIVLSLQMVTRLYVSKKNTFLFCINGHSMYAWSKGIDARLSPTSVFVPGPGLVPNISTFTLHFVKAIKHTYAIHINHMLLTCCAPKPNVY